MELTASPCLRCGLCDVRRSRGGFADARDRGPRREWEEQESQESQAQKKPQTRSVALRIRGWVGWLFDAPAVGGPRDLGEPRATRMVGCDDREPYRPATVR